MVLRGAAELVNDQGRTPLRAGQRAARARRRGPVLCLCVQLRGLGCLRSLVRRAAQPSRHSISTQYLPETVQPYASTFDQYGSMAVQHHVRLRLVSHGRRRMAPVLLRPLDQSPPFGWTWIGSDAWSWPTHHYARWGLTAAAWFWIPEPPGDLPGFPGERPGIRQLVSARLGQPSSALRVRVFYGGRYYDCWNAWTVVPGGQLRPRLRERHFTSSSPARTPPRRPRTQRLRRPARAGHLDYRGGWHACAAPTLAHPTQPAGSRTSPGQWRRRGRWVAQRLRRASPRGSVGSRLPRAARRGRRRCGRPCSAARRPSRRRASVGPRVSRPGPDAPGIPAPLLFGAHGDCSPS